MPKIIKNVRENILRNAKDIIAEKDFNSLTIRDVAKRTGYGVGTIYNYFPNKLTILAAILLEEWSVKETELSEKISKSETWKDSLSTIYSEISSFYLSHKQLFFSIQIPEDFRSKLHFGHDAFIRNVEKYVIKAQEKFSYLSNEKDRYVACLILIQASATYELPFDDIYESLNKLLIGGNQK